MSGAVASIPTIAESPEGFHVHAVREIEPVSESQFGVVPFTLKRSTDLWDRKGYTTKTETAHGLVRLESGRLVVQWRLAVHTESVGGASWTKEEEIEPVRETVIAIERLAGAAVTGSRRGFLRPPRLVIAAADLMAFDEIAGGQGLKLKHPAKLVFRIGRRDRLAAEEFAAELALALARLPGRTAGAGPAALPSPEQRS